MYIAKPQLQNDSDIVFWIIKKGAEITIILWRCKIKHQYSLQYVMHAGWFHNILSILLRTFFFIEHEEPNEYQRFWDFEFAKFCFKMQV